MDDLKLYEEIVRLKKERLPAALATVVETSGSSPRKAGAKMLVYPDGSIAGTVGGGATEADTIAAALESLRSRGPQARRFSLTEENGSVCGGNMTIYIEPLIAAPLLLIIGSGHVAQAVGRAARVAGFLTIPVEAAGSLDQELAGRGGDSGAFIFIATSDHRQDFAAVQASLLTTARYIGVLGSRRKKKAMEAYLNEQGVDPLALARITTPAGLEIGAETPEEIAVSVVAQMILMRRSGNGKDSRPAAGCGTLAKDGGLQTSLAAG